METKEISKKIEKLLSLIIDVKGMVRILKGFCTNEEYFEIEYILNIIEENLEKSSDIIYCVDLEIF